MDIVIRNSKFFFHKITSYYVLLISTYYEKTFNLEIRRHFSKILTIINYILKISSLIN
jgi:hypothetical protein